MDSKSVLASAVVFLLLVYVKAQPRVFDITKYGGKPNGDITQALLSAWKEACASPTPATVVIPGGNFMAGQVKLAGPCKSAINFKVQGTVKAPADPAKFREDQEWFTFQNIDRFTMNGGGTFDGQGATAWTQNDCSKTGKCSKLPINLSFNFITNAMIQDITSLNSKLMHVNLLGCKDITFLHFTVTAPGTSLNTDGIHVGRSTGVNITDCVIKTGDDCVSIGDGSQQVTIQRVTCGPGHGIAVGSLGKYQNEEPVIGIFVRNCTISNTMNGVRVKTWPASPAGVASDMHFEDIIMENVGTPVLIDQQYCPYNQCTANVPSRVKISKVSFKNIRGTSSTPVAVKLVCSGGLPCDGVEIGDINLRYNGKEGPAKSECANVKPAFSGKQFPAVCANPAQAS